MAESAEVVAQNLETIENGSETGVRKSTLAEAADREWTATTSNLFARAPLTTFSFDLDKNKKKENGTPAASGVKLDTPTGFVFGSKLADRVTNAKKNDSDEGPKDASSIFKQMAATAPAGGLFASASSSGTSFLKPRTTDDAEKNRFEAEEPSKVVPVVPEVETVTGEEEERNCLHIACKFFIYDGESKSWQERGMGTLRINESMDTREFRIVGRATGNQRVCMNSKIFPEMILEKISEKRLKLSAHSPDHDAPQLFVIQATPNSIVTIEQKLLSLIELSKSRKRRWDDSDSSDQIPAKNPQIVVNGEESDAVNTSDSSAGTHDNSAGQRNDGSTEQKDEDDDENSDE